MHTSVPVFHCTLSQLVIEEDETVLHMFFLPRSPCHPLFPLSLSPFSLFFSLPFSPRSNVENAASPKPPLLPSKSPKIKINPTLLFYSALSLHSSPFSLCFPSPCQTAPPCPTHRSVNMIEVLIPPPPLDLIYLLACVCMCLPDSSPCLSASVCH